MSINKRPILELAESIIDSEGDVSPEFLENNKKQVRLLPDDPNLMDDFLLTHAFLGTGKNAFFVIPFAGEEEESISRKPINSITINNFPFEKTPFSGIIFSEDLQNFCFFHDGDEYFLLVGDEEFLNRGNPLPLKFNKEYFFCEVEEPDHLKRIKRIWKKFEPFMFKG